MWKTLLTSLTDDCEFSPAATAHDISSAESALDLEFPAMLKSLLGETNGIQGEYGQGLLWNAQQIVESNLEFRRSVDFKELYMPFDPLLFFADTGGGDQFAYRILAGKIRHEDIFVWSHEDDSRTWVAPSLQDFYRRWLSGEIEVG